MPTSKTKTSRRGTRSASSKPAGNAARRKKQTARRKQRATARATPKPAATRAKAAPRAKAASRAKTTKLPSWKDLTKRNERAASRPRTGSRIDQFSTVKFGLLLLVLAAGITFYVGHVQATQDLLAEVQRTRLENLRLHLKLNRLQGEFEQATAPEVIYRRARALGLEEGIDYGPTIRAADDER